MAEETHERLVSTALDTFLLQGIRKTSMDDVAKAAGVTRVTIYRYFQDKKELVRAAFLKEVVGIELINREFIARGHWEIDAYLDAIGKYFRGLPQGNLAARHEELARVYPDVADEFRRRRRAAIHKTFGLLLEVADSQGLVREHLHRRVVEAYFQAAVINIMEHPALTSLNLSLAEIYATASSIFMHGILKEPQPSESDLARCEA
jgi:AcrR family transcriptional regulator